MSIVFDSLELGLVELEARLHAPVKLAHFARGSAVRLDGLGLVPKDAHRVADGPDDLLVGLWPLPQDLRMALDEVAVDLVEVDYRLLDVAALLGQNLVAHADGVLELAQPLAGLALLLVVLHRQVVTEDDDGEEERVHDLLRAGLEVLDALDHVGGLGALSIARGDSGAKRVREHDFPSAGPPLFSHIRLAEDDFCAGCQSCKPQLEQRSYADVDLHRPDPSTTKRTGRQHSFLQWP